MEIKEHLSRTLPAYMIPSYFVPLESIPLTPNGKLDKKALPRPASLQARLQPAGATYVSPETENEKNIAAAWREILQVKEVGIYDNFFDLGGNSLKVIQLNRKLQEIFGTNISIAAMFRNLTVDFLNRYLKQEGVDKKQKKRKEISRIETLDRSRDIYKNTIFKHLGGKSDTRR
jgi:hypothetical protein